MNAIKVFARSPEFVPSRQNVTDAGYDLRAYIETEDTDEIVTQLNQSRLLHDPAVFINGKLIKLQLPNIYALFKAQHYQDTAAVIIPSRQTVILSAGFKVKLPQALTGSNTVMQIYPRSGLGIKSSLILANSVGIIDQNYIANEVMLGLYNNSPYAHIITHGTRVAQALITSVQSCKFESTTDWDSTNDRGGGLGHSGV